MARRLLATYLTITALTLVVVVVPLGRVFADREQSRLTYDIERDAQAVASLVEDDLETGRRSVHRRERWPTTATPAAASWLSTPRA